MAKTLVTSTVIKINDREINNSFKGIRSEVVRLEMGLKKLTPGTEEFRKKAEELKNVRSHFERVKNEIDLVNGKIKESGGVFGFLQRKISNLGDIFKQVFSANITERFLSNIFSSGKQTIDQLLKVADAMTDVEKTSGMTTEQVKKLWEQFDDMDTRTGKLERLKIAEVGGRLGVPIDEMRDFVQEIDKAYVALGDSFEGGLEGVVEQLGKIKGLFEGTKEMSYAEAINRVGSALNTLAAQGTASEGNISEFVLKVGTLPDALKPSIDKVLGLGAAFEESGIDARIASSVFMNFITTAGENIGNFAHSMHLTKTQAEELINTKPEEFFLRFAAGMKGLNATETAKVLESLKLNSLEVQKAVGAAANRTDEFKKSMQTAGVEMDKMTSLQDEFNKKNNNAPAIVEKLKILSVIFSLRQMLLIFLKKSFSSDFSFSTINSDEITAGNYEDFITINYEQKTLKIPVNLQVLEFANIDSKGANFCLDKVILNVNKMFENGVFARINLLMQFTTDEGNSEFNSVYSIPFFQGKSTTDLGQKVQNYFPIFSKHLFENSPKNFNNKLIYRPANVLVTVEELDVNYNVLHSEILDNIKMFAGKKPAKFPFFTNFDLRRRFPDFAHIFSFYTGDIIPANFNNNTAFNPISDNDVQSVFITKESVLDFYFIENELDIKFLPFPKVERQIVLQWLNENLVPECFVFSGSYTIENNFEHSVDNYKINGKKYDTKEISKITLRTGFIPKEEILILNEIAKSKVSFLKIEDKIYQCFCTSQKLIQQDSEENLSQREMEFFVVE